MTGASETASKKMSLSFARNLAVSGDASVGDDLSLASDGFTVKFVVDAYIDITDVHNTCLTINRTAHL